MDRISVFAFKFNNGIIFCVGSDWAINDLRYHFIIQRDKGKHIEFSSWYHRIAKNRIYCRFEPIGLQGLLIGLRFWISIRKAKLWIKGYEYTEALFLTKQTEVKEILELTEEQAEFTRKNSIWKDRFSYD